MTQRFSTTRSNDTVPTLASSTHSAKPSLKAKKPRKGSPRKHLKFLNQNRPRKTLSDRLWAKVSKSGHNGCWLFTGTLNNGYGQIQRGGRDEGLVRAHVAAWEVTNGPVPDGLFVCHHCDVRNCVRPEHLFLGTAQDNSNDMVAKNRQAVGDHHPPTRIPDAQVPHIRALRASGLSCAEIAVMFNTTRGNISKIVNRRTRKRAA